jgi:dihydrofolate reductase
MIVSLIAAMADNRVIGRDGGIPWDIPADRRRFRELTMGHTLIMGRKTYESIGRPLSGRRIVMLTRNREFTAPAVLVARDLAEALAACTGQDEVFICGGVEVYRQALGFADRIYLTVVHLEVAGDTSFPAIPAEFAEVGREELAGTIPPCTFFTLCRARQ